MPPPQGTWNPIEGPGDYTFTKLVHNDTYPAIDPAKANLKGKTIFVNGASRGIGKAIAISFAKGGASSIAIAARSDLKGVEDAMLKAASEVGRTEPKILRLQMDVTDQTSVDNAAKAIEKDFGKIDVLINNAAILGEFKSVADSDPESWWQTYNVNVRGPYLVTRACLPLLLKSESKTIIAISSVGALSTLPTGSAYQATKTALTRLTNFVAAEYAEQGLVAFSVHPGNVLTDMTIPGMSDELRPVFTETPEICADTLVYLVNEKRDWLSGRYINVTWDMPELLNSPKKDEIIKGDKLKLKLVL